MARWPARLLVSVVAAPFTKTRSSWTVNGTELPFAPRSQFGLPAAEVDPRTYIPVDRIRGPVLLACGDGEAGAPPQRTEQDRAATPRADPGPSSRPGQLATQALRGVA